MIKSPLQNIPLIERIKYESKRDASILKFTELLIDLHNKINDKLEEVNKTINKKVGPKGEKGDRGDRGPKGDRGLPGEITNLQDAIDIIQKSIRIPKDGLDGKHGGTPVKGIHYFTEEEISQIKQDILKEVKKIFAGREDSAEDILNLFTKRDKKISIKQVDGLEQTISAFSNQLGRGGYIHGGGDTLVAGPGIVLTPNSDGTKTVSMIGGGTWYEEVLTRTDGTNYTLAHNPSSIVLIFLNGQRLTFGIDYNRVGTAIIMTSPTLATDVLTATYS
jgi:hypothetical protein